MMARRRDTTRALIFAFVAVVILGLALLLSSKLFHFGGLAFEVFTYVLSIVALVLAVLSVINTIRQNRALRRMVHDVHTAIAELEEVAHSNDTIERELKEEYRMNKVITDVLSEYGVGDTPKLRKTIAKRVSHRLQTTPAKKTLERRR